MNTRTPKTKVSSYKSATHSGTDTGSTGTSFSLKDNRTSSVIQKKQVEAVANIDSVQHLPLNNSHTIQLHGPGVQNDTFVLGDGAHLDRHLDDWQKYFPEVTTVQDVERIAGELFDNTEQEDWKNRSGTYAVDHPYRGQTVRLVWGLGGIVSCFIVTPRQQQPQPQVHHPQPQVHYPQPQAHQHPPQVHNPQPQAYQPQAQYHFHRDYYWTSDWSYWWDHTLNQWRSRFEGNVDWLYQ